MIFKNTWLWIIVAVGLLLASLWHYQHSRHAAKGPRRILPQINPNAVANVQIRLETQLQMRAQKTNSHWILTEPLRCQAEDEKIQGLLSALEQLTPAISITRRELMSRPNAEEEYGFGAPQATIILRQGDYRAQVFIGSHTPPGDQVFLQVVGDEGIYVVDAALLSFIPRKPDDWRATRLLDLRGVAFDRITITNSGKGFDLRKDATNKWKIVTSDFSTRAQASKVEELLERVQALRVQQFLPDAPKPDLDALGLQNAEFQFAIADGSNSIAALHFGKSQTNDSSQVFARKAGENSIVLVNRTNLTPWPSLINFRDPYLVGAAERPRRIDVHGGDNFSLLWQTNDIWKVMPQNFIADTNSVKDLLQLLSEMQIAVFFKDVVPEQGLAAYGLDKPSLEYVLHAMGGNESGMATNGGIRLQFGTNHEDKVYVRRSDETAVYEVNAWDTQRLPRASWQLRDRHIWKFSIEELASVTIEQQGKTCQILRKGDHLWSLAPGSQGVVEPLAVEETLLDLVDLSTEGWIGRAVSNLADHGFTTNDQRITLEFKNGEKRMVQLSPITFMNRGVVAAVLEGETWVFAIPPSLRRDMINYLSIPTKTL
jgi:hypothetical protein